MQHHGCNTCTLPFGSQSALTRHQNEHQAARTYCLGQVGSDLISDYINRHVDVDWTDLVKDARARFRGIVKHSLVLSSAGRRRRVVRLQTSFTASLDEVYFVSLFKDLPQLCLDKKPSGNRRFHFTLSGRQITTQLDPVLGCDWNTFEPLDNNPTHSMRYIHMESDDSARLYQLKCELLTSSVTCNEQSTTGERNSASYSLSQLQIAYHPESTERI